MNIKIIIDQIKEKYPGKKIILSPHDQPTEILCEIEPTSDHPKWSKAISVIDETAMHYHQKTKEIYKVTQGELRLFLNGEEHLLKTGDEVVILPGQKHYAIGNETWVECYSEPGWIMEDHLFQ